MSDTVDARAAAPVAAPDRMPRIAAERLSDDQKRAIDEFTEGRGYAIRGPWVALLRSPPVMRAVRIMNDYLRFKSPLAESLKEMMILVAAREWTQQYVWNSHYPAALKAGLRREIADAIASRRRPADMAEDEAAAYDLATEILRFKRVNDATYARAVARFDEAGVVELLSIVGQYSSLAIIMNTTQTPLPEGAAPALKP
jgi:4-carboxymuconolactone decarboxylase